MTGKTGTPHVTSQQFRQMLEGTVGQGSYILQSGENLEPELVSNNSLKIRSGIMCHHGNLSVIDLGTYDEVTIQNGTQGMKRIDLVVNRYTKNDETGIEDNEWVVIQGTPDAESPVAPAHTEGNMQEGDLVDDCPVFRLHLDGINVTEVEKLLSVASDISTQQEQIAAHEEEISELNGNFYANIQSGIFTNKKSGDTIKIRRPVTQESNVVVVPRYNTVLSLRCNCTADTLQQGDDEFVLYAYDTQTGAISTSTTLEGYYFVIPANATTD